RRRFGKIWLGGANRARYQRFEFVTDRYVSRPPLQFQNIRWAEYRRGVGDIETRSGVDYRLKHRLRREVQCHLEEEAVYLCFGQDVSALHLDRVLGCQYEERLG